LTVGSICFKFIGLCDYLNKVEYDEKDDYAGRMINGHQKGSPTENFGRREHFF